MTSILGGATLPIEVESNARGKEPGSRWEARQRWWSAFILGGVLGLAVFLGLQWHRFQELEALGYVGAFIISLLGSATILVPVPALLGVFALGGLMGSPLLVGIAAGAGSALGEITGYTLGATSRNLLKGNPGRRFAWLEGWMKHRGGWVIFLFAATPNPLFDAVGAIAGASRYPLWRFLGISWAGKTVKGLIVAYAGALGWSFIQRWLELGF